MPTIAYLRVSTVGQDHENQKLAILEYAQKERLHIDDWFNVVMSTRRSSKDRRVDEMAAALRSGDTLLVSELSRLGRSTSEVIELVNRLVAKGVHLVAIKQNIRLNPGQQDMASKVMVTIFSLLSELERDILSERTKMGLVRARANGKRLGRPPGPGKSVLDGKEEEIQGYLAKGVSKASIAKILGVSWPTLHKFMKRRGV